MGHTKEPYSSNYSPQKRTSSWGGIRNTLNLHVKLRKQIAGPIPRRSDSVGWQGPRKFACPKCLGLCQGCWSRDYAWRIYSHPGWPFSHVANNITQESTTGLESSSGISMLSNWSSSLYQMWFQPGVWFATILGSGVPETACTGSQEPIVKVSGILQAGY